jgi:PKD domain
MLTRKRVALVLAGAIVLLLFALRGRRHREGVEVAQATPLTDEPLAPRSVTVPAPVAPVDPSAGLLPIIDAIEVEKSDVCEGEENLVTVHAHTDGHAEDGYLHYRGGAADGQFMVFHGAGQGTVQAPIGVFGRGNTATWGQASYRVRECKADHKLLVGHTLLTNTNAEFQLWARLIPFGVPTPFEAVRYEWDFGDGTAAGTTEPMTTHDFSVRPQRQLFESYLVTVTAVDAAGHRVVGRAGLELPSQYFHNLEVAHVVTLMERMTPRLPQLDPDGVVRQSYRLWHYDPEPIRVTALYRRQIEVADMEQNFSPTAPPKVPEEVHVDPAKVLGTTVIPPSGIEFRLSIDTRTSNVAAQTYRVVGVTRSGMPVIGSFSLMRPPPMPTRERHMPVEDPVMQEKIARAMQLTGKPFVTADDMQRLELAGKFADLR